MLSLQLIFHMVHIYNLSFTWCILLCIPKVVQFTSRAFIPVLNKVELYNYLIL